MKKQLITLLFLGFSFTAFTQNHLHLKSGKTFTSFVFKDSESLKTKDLNFAFNNYFGISYERHISKRSIFRTEFGFKEAGATAIIDEMKYDWKFNYLDVSLAYLLKIIGNENYGINIGAAPYLGFLLNGTQSIGEASYNVKKEAAIKTIDFGMYFLSNAQIKVAKNIYVSLEYRYSLGILNIESDRRRPDQVTRNTAHSILAGLSFNLSK